MMVSMVVRPVTSPLTLFLLQYPCQPFFLLLKMPGVDVKTGGGRPVKNKYFHIYISFELIYIFIILNMI